MPNRHFSEIKNAAYYAVLIFATVVLFLGGIGYTYYGKTVKLAEERVQADQRLKLSEKKNLIALHFSDTLYDTQILAERVGRLTNPDGEREENLLVGELFVSFCRYKTEYGQIRFIANDGNEIMRVERRENRVVTVTKDGLQDKKDRYYFQAASRLEPGDVYVSPLDLNVEDEQIQTPFEPMIRFAAPVFDRNKKRRGVLVVNFLGKVILDDIRKEAQRGKAAVYLLSSDGYYLLGEKAEHEWGFMLEGRKHVSFKSHFPDIWNKLQRKVRAQYKTDRGLFTFERIYPLSVFAKRGHVSPEIAALANEYNWILVKRLPPEKLDELRREILNNLLGLLAPSFLFIGTGAWFFGRAIARRKIGEHLLLESRERMSLASIAAGIGIWEWSIPDNRLIWDEMMFSIYGIPAESFSGTYAEYENLIHPDDRTRLNRAVMDALAARYELRETFRIVRPNGDVRYIAAEAKTYRDRTGSPIRMVGINIDITRRKLDQEERDRFFSISPDLLCIAGFDGCFKRINPAWEKTLGFTHEELMAEPFLNFVHPDDRQETLDETAQLARGNVTVRFENRYRRKDGTYRWLSWVSAPYPEQKLIYAVARDVTEEKEIGIALANIQTELETRLLELASEREKYRTLFEQAKKNENDLLEVSGKIQNNLLVGEVPRFVKGLDIAFRLIPSQKVDGDFVDFAGYSDRELDVFVGDVMGKGIPAALTGAAARNAFLRNARVFRDTENRISPAPLAFVMENIGADISTELMKINHFITVVYARIDLLAWKMSLIDCGHTRTIHYRSRSRDTVFLKGTNLPLGVQAGEKYLTIETSIENDDVIVFYSDGITEAMPPDKFEIFGEKRLTEAVVKHAHLSAGQLIDAVLRAVDTYTHGEQSRDDITLVVVRIGTSRTGIREAEITHPADLRHMQNLYDFLEKYRPAIPQLADETAFYNLRLCVTEAVTNIVKHAYSGCAGDAIKIVLSWNAREIKIQLMDTGRAFLDWRNSSLLAMTESDSGRGMYMINSLMDEIHYERIGGTINCLTMLKRYRTA